MGIKSRGDKRLFVLDTNVLMHDPTSIFRFAEHDIFVPMVVPDELPLHLGQLDMLPIELTYDVGVPMVLDPFQGFCEVHGILVHRSPHSSSDVARKIVSGIP